MNTETSTVYSNRVYRNQGNLALLSLVKPGSKRVLDVGCGSGDNARILSHAVAGVEVVGITASKKEALIAIDHMADCLVLDIENQIPSELEKDSFDCLIFSHVLEHLREPATVLADFLPYLKCSGQVLIAVPNIANIRARLQVAAGRFEYQASGVFDETHLRFFTYDSVERALLKNSQEVDLVEKTVTGAVPLWLLRRYLLPAPISKLLDILGCRFFPNLFGGQVILSLVKKPALINESRK